MFSTSYWDPFTSLGAFGLRSDPLFGELRRQASRRLLEGDLPRARGGRSTPHVDYRESKEGYAFAFDVPGLSEGDIDLEVHGQVLTLRAERKHVVPEGFTAHRVERPSFRLAQSFTLPTRVDVEQVRANLENGVLTVTLPKAAEAHARRIPVQGAENAENAQMTDRSTIHNAEVQS